MRALAVTALCGELSTAVSRVMHQCLSAGRCSKEEYNIGLPPYTLPNNVEIFVKWKHG